VKRIFDVVIVLLSAIVWVPAALLCIALILIFDGRPIFYKSFRQVGKDRTIQVLKFRTMRRDADKIFNRDTVPIAGVRFLNTPPNSDLYTPIGRFIERYGLTELPQVLHVLAGSMSLVGNRPLPGRVMEVLTRDFPNANDRFLTNAGLTGVVQLVGRDQITDADRLSMELEYCRACLNGYSIALDLWLLVYTVLIVSSVRDGFTVDQVRAAVRRFSRPSERIVLGHLDMPVASQGSSDVSR